MGIKIKLNKYQLPGNRCRMNWEESAMLACSQHYEVRKWGFHKGQRPFGGGWGCPHILQFPPRMGGRGVERAIFGRILHAPLASGTTKDENNQLCHPESAQADEGSRAPAGEQTLVFLKNT